MSHYASSNTAQPNRDGTSPKQIRIRPDKRAELSEVDDNAFEFNDFGPLTHPEQDYSEVSHGADAEYDDEEYDDENQQVASESIVALERSETDKMAERVLTEARQRAAERELEATWPVAKDQPDSDGDDDESIVEGGERPNEGHAEEDGIELADDRNRRHEQGTDGPKAADIGQTAAYQDRIQYSDATMSERATDAMLKKIAAEGDDGSRLLNCCVIAVCDFSLGKWETTQAIHRYAAQTPFSRTLTNRDIENAFADARHIQKVNNAADKVGLGLPANLLISKCPAKELISKVLPAAQVGIISAPKNHLKTKVALDLCVSLASETAFLNHFSVDHSVCCGIFVAEDSPLDAHEALQRICRARGIDDMDALGERLVVSSMLPDFTSKDWFSNMKELIELIDLKFVAIDGAYLALGGADQRSLAAMGDALAPLQTLSRDTGCTILLSVHHKQVERSGWPSLHDISGVGFEELARFWLQINSRQNWDPATGQHTLRLLIGNKHGENRYHLDVREGDDEGGRVWEPVVSMPSGRGPLEQQGEPGHNAKSTSKREMWMEQARAVLRQHPEGLTMTAIGEAAKIPEKRRKEVIDALLASREIEETPVKVSNQNTPQEGYRLRQPS